MKYVNEVHGYNSRLDPLQAAVLRVKLPHLDEWNARLSAIDAFYQQGLVGCGLTLPFVPDWAEPSWHLYVVQYSQRDSLHKALADAGVGTIIHYPIPPHCQQAYAQAGSQKGVFSIAERTADQVVSLPMGPHLPDSSFAEIVELITQIVC